MRDIYLSAYAPKHLWGFFMAAEADKKFMRMALDLAERGRGSTAPNPMVGAVLVKQGKVIGRGYHTGPGRDHAEIVALKSCKVNPAGATLYVNLEPCDQVGRTGPCTRTIIEAGITRVVMPFKDPFPLVNGRGIRKLRQAGLDVELGTLRKEARRLNDAYLVYHTHKRPFLTLKVAQSIDGRIATSSGESRWISGADSLAYAHILRAQADAVVVGAGTVRTDNPRLTVRRIKGRNPYRIVLTGSGRIPASSRLLKENKDYRTVIAGSASALDAIRKAADGRAPLIWQLKKTRNGFVDLSDFLVKAYEFGIQSILVEGGATLATSLLKAGLVDKYVAITAPILIGDGISSIGKLQTKRIDDAMTFADSYCFCNGRDHIFVGYLRKG